MVQTSETWQYPSPAPSDNHIYTNYGGILYNGKSYFAPDLYTLEQIVKYLEQEQGIDTIYNIFMIPNILVSNLPAPPRTNISSIFWTRYV